MLWYLGKRLLQLIPVFFGATFLIYFMVFSLPGDPIAALFGDRQPTPQEQQNIAYGRTLARQLAQYDIGQTVVVAELACVAIEAMEGTDTAIQRAGEIMHSLAGESSTLSRDLTVVKIAKPNQDMRFDVPVIGVATVEAMAAAGVTALSIDAGRTLVFDRAALAAAADRAGIAIVARSLS